MKLVRTHAQQCNHHKDIAQRIHQERGACSKRDNQQARKCRTHEASRIEGGRIEADRARDVGIANQFRVEGGANGCIECAENAHDKGEHADLPDLHHAGDNKDAHERRTQSGADVGEHEQVSFVEAVG